MSIEVKLITVLTSLILLCLALYLFVSQELIGFKIVVFLCTILVFYFLVSNSLATIAITDDELILHYHFRKKEIKINTIENITKIGFNNLSTFAGSKGVFGYNGYLVSADSKIYVNDRKSMVKIVTSRRNYMVSIDDPESLIREIEEKLNTNFYVS